MSRYSNSHRATNEGVKSTEIQFCTPTGYSLENHVKPFASAEVESIYHSQNV